MGSSSFFLSPFLVSSSLSRLFKSVRASKAMSHHQYYDGSLPSAHPYSRPPSPSSVTLQAPLNTYRLPLPRSRPSSPLPAFQSPSTEHHSWIAEAQGSNWDDTAAEPSWGRSPRASTKVQRSLTACIRCRELKVRFSYDDACCTMNNADLT